MVHASPVPTTNRILTQDNLRAWANSMAAMTAEPILTILDRWPDEELAQHRTKPTSIKEPSLNIPRTIMMVTITFMALLAVLIAGIFHRGGWRGSIAIGQGQ
jgi:hypothetical protein